MKAFYSLFSYWQILTTNCHRSIIQINMGEKQDLDEAIHSLNRKTPVHYDIKDWFWERRICKKVEWEKVEWNKVECENVKYVRR